MAFEIRYMYTEHCSMYMYQEIYEQYIVIIETTLSNTTQEIPSHQIINICITCTCIGSY